MEFKKVLAKYYMKWYSDSVASIYYCAEKGYIETANEYAERAEQYRQLIEANKEAIEFFSIGDNASKVDRALPEKFRNYK